MMGNNKTFFLVIFGIVSLTWYKNAHSLQSYFAAAGPNNGLYIFVSNNNGTFQEPILIDYAEGYIMGAGIEDYNNDGFLDIIYQCDPGIASLLINDGNNEFTKYFIVQGLDTGRQAGAAADFDLDGFADYIFPSYLNGTNAFLYLFWGVDGYCFEVDMIPTPWAASGNSWYGIQGFDIGDINCDGLMDILACNYANSNSDYVYKLINIGNRQFQQIECFNLIPLDLDGSPYLTINDFTDDGELDVIVGQDDDGDPGQTWTFQGDENGNFELLCEGYDVNTYNETGTNYPGGGSIGDSYNFNISSNNAYVVAPHWNGNNYCLASYLSNGDGTFQLPEILNNDYYYIIHSAPPLAWGYTPRVSNIEVEQCLLPSKSIEVSFDVFHQVTNLVGISLQISSNSGLSWNIPTTHAWGDIGPNISPGTGRTIYWNAGLDYPNQYNENMVIKIIADDGQ